MKTPLTRAEVLAKIAAGCKNFAGENLSYVDLSSRKRIRLSKADFTGADLRHANLSGADLTGANFTGANLAYVNLSGATLTLANFFEANLYYADLYNAVTKNANFQDADLTGTLLSKYMQYKSPT